MGMRDRAKATATKVDQALAQRELTLLLETAIDVEQLTPEITAHPDYDTLIAVINDATQANNNVALLEEKIKQLGESGYELASKIISIIK